MTVLSADFPNALTLRHANTDDAALLAEIHTRSWASAYRGVLPDNYLEREMPAERLAHWQARVHELAAGAGIALIALRHGQPIGFVCVEEKNAQSSVLVDNLHALPEHKGSGAGTALLDAARLWALEQGAQSLHLLVLENNHAAIGFYESRGWQLSGREGAVLGGHDVVALVYSKALA